MVSIFITLLNFNGKRVKNTLNYLNLNKVNFIPSLLISIET